MRCGRKSGSSLSRIVSILLVLLLAVSQLAAWPTKSEKTLLQPDQMIQQLQVIPVEVVEVQQQMPEEIQSSSPEATPEKPLKTNSTMPSQEQKNLLESLKSDDSKDSRDLADLRATISEIRTLLDIQRAANKDLEEQYIADLEAKDARIAQLEADYKALSSQYGQVVYSLAAEQNKEPPHNYKLTVGMSMLKDSATGDYGLGADLVYRFAGPFTILGGAHFFPEQGRDIIYKAGVGISF